MTAELGWGRRWLAAGLLASCLGLGAALRAATPPPEAQPIDLRYALQKMGFTVADMALTVAPAGQDIRSELVIRGQGLVQWFSGSVTHMVATSRLGAGGTVEPVSFDARYAKSDRTRDIKMRWDDGELQKATVSSQGRRAKPSEVPADLQAHTVDPLTALARLRGWLGEPGRAEGDTVTVPVFDGRKRADLQAKLLAPGTYDTTAGAVPVTRLEAKLIPRSGFEEGEDDYVSWPDGPQHWYEVLVSQDGRYAPLAVREQGSTVAELTTDCSRTASACPAPAD